MSGFCTVLAVPRKATDHRCNNFPSPVVARSRSCLAGTDGARTVRSAAVVAEPAGYSVLPDDTAVVVAVAGRRGTGAGWVSWGKGRSGCPMPRM